MLKVEVKNRINFPPMVNLSKTLDEISKSIIIPLLKENILTNTDIHGRRFPALSKSTIREKGHARPLQDQGLLYKSFKSKHSGNSILIYIGSERNEIARYLQIEGVGKNKKTFKFFGITQGMERDALQYFSKVIYKWVRDANRK